MLVTEKKKVDSYYDALIKKEKSYVGIFYVGVKTTLVFCIATCTARKPKKENVEFYTSFKEALDHGYRPCKICKPTENSNEAPHQIKAAIQLVKDRPKEKIKDYQLRQMDISPELVRRWFNKNYGMTFQAYQRSYRINNTFKELKDGGNTTSTAFGSGYESLSGFGYTFKKVLGASPSKSCDTKIILIDRFTTPLGPMFACATEKGICLLEFVDRKMIETEFKDLQRLLKASIVTGENDHLIQVKREVAEYFDGARKSFDVSLDTPGTDFQNIVWRGLLEIPTGETRSYQEQAVRIGNPKAVRAVASANGMNRVAVIIPCHRVIGKDGSLTGYAGGLERKKWLLDHEAKQKQISLDLR